MTHDRRFRFGVDLQAPFEGLGWLDTFRACEDLGYSTIFVPDHFDGGPGPIAALASAAAVTSQIGLGTLVLAADYRHPVVLAREIATIDQISSGRVELGLGAGWKAWDYEASGIPMDRPGVRVSRLIEYVEVMKGLFGGSPFSFDGEHFTITELPGTPAPHRPGGPPILIGGGAPRMLRHAGAVADIVGVNPSIHSGEIDAEAAADGLADRIDEKFTWLHQGAGDRFDEIELNAWLAVAELTDDPAGVAELVAPAFDASPEELLESPIALVAARSEVGDILRRRRERWGYSYTVIPGDRAHAFAPSVAELTGT